MNATKVKLFTCLTVGYSSTNILPPKENISTDSSQDFIWQQDGSHLHFRCWLNDAHPHRWLRRGDHGDCPWRARSPDLTPCDYFLRGYLKDKVFVPPLPASRITATVETITLDMLIKVWQGLDYLLDVCRVTKGAHIEHF
jgi:hypothetical protein